ncbi:MAG: hypothetical protein ACLPKB_22015 [Xanthobacteraceae bacterium]
MTVRTISSGQTIFVKFIFPVIWIGGFGLGTLALWLAPMHARGGAPPPEMKWVFLAVWTFGTAFILWLSAGLKRVCLDEATIYISNYVREISVPLNLIEDVTENRWINIRPVTIKFRHPTDFGDKVTFMPRTRVFWPGKPNPIVAELQALANGRGGR